MVYVTPNINTFFQKKQANKTNHTGYKKGGALPSLLQFCLTSTIEYLYYLAELIYLQLHQQPFASWIRVLMEWWVGYAWTIGFPGDANNRTID